MKTLIVWLFLISSTLAGEPLSIRIANEETYGYCWWACADSILRTNGRESDLVGLAVRTGLGYGPGKGADLSSIKLLLWHTNVEHTYLTPDRCWSRKENVIATCSPWTSQNLCHAIVVIDSRSYILNGYRYYDVVYWDPNEPEQYSVMPWYKFRAICKYGHIVK